MKRPHRRQFLHLAAGAAALPAVARTARAQAYPTRPVRVVVTYAAGGPNDIIARLMGQWLTEHLGQPFVVENRPGAAGNIGTEAVVRASADGYTLLLASTNNAINAALYDKLNFNFIRDIAPVAAISRSMFVMVVHPSIPAKTVPEFIAYSKANPGKINMASSGIGSTSHVFGELFRMMTGVDTAHVPYRGVAPAMTDLLAGQVQVCFVPTPGLIEYIKSGRLRALGVTTATRWEALPDVPAIGEFVSGYEASGWWGIGLPKNTPTEIVNTLNKEINVALADPKLTARLAELGGTVLALSPAQFGKLIADTTEKVGQGREIRGHEAGVSRFENPAGICFPPFLHYAERRILPKPARKRDVPKSQIIATGSTGAIGGHYRFIVHLLSVQARMREDAVRAI